MESYFIKLNNLNILYNLNRMTQSEFIFGILTSNICCEFKLFLMEKIMNNQSIDNIINQLNNMTEGGNFLFSKNLRIPLTLMKTSMGFSSFFYPINDVTGSGNLITIQTNCKTITFENNIVQPLNVQLNVIDVLLYRTISMRYNQNMSTVSEVSTFGTEWVQVASFTDTLLYTAVSQDARTITTLSSNNGNMYISYDGGNTWTQKTFPVLWSGLSMSDDGIYQIATTNTGNYYYTIDSGITWNITTYSFKSIACSTISSTGQYQLFSSTGNDKSINNHISKNYGKTFTAFSASTNDTLPKNFLSVAMMVSSNGSNVFICNGKESAVNSYSIYRSTDGGALFAPIGFSQIILCAGDQTLSNITIGDSYGRVFSGIPTVLNERINDPKNTNIKTITVSSDNKFQVVQYSSIFWSSQDSGKSFAKNTYITGVNNTVLSKNGKNLISVNNSVYKWSSDTSSVSTMSVEQSNRNNININGVDIPFIDRNNLGTQLNNKIRTFQTDCGIYFEIFDM